MNIAGSLRSEWIKLRSLRSTWYTLAGLFAAGIGITALSTASAGADYARATVAERATWDPTALSLKSFLIAQLIIGVLGVLVVTSEYATGLIQSSLTATPRRSRLLAAKVLLAASIAVVAGQVLMFAAFLIGQGFLAGQQVPHVSLGDPGVFGAVVGGGLYLAAIALLAVGLGTLVRATAGALAALVGIVLLVPVVSALFPDWLQWLFTFWPSKGAAAIFSVTPDPAFPNPWLNLVGLYAIVAAVLVAAFAAFRRRDV
ncbi:ABC transporter permease [Amycolatopsis jejuensis]|uniref:ABC transporter permease n=1 Tax=Amycolatopsis jejuensis TaxID=330084 RepID=UPI00052679C3|nr:ABC transporter permease [Amycolatopsis jejuensis]